MIYLDSAATTLQKPPAVAQAAADAINQMASPGRGGYHAAMSAAEMAFACREAAAGLFHVSNPENVVFTLNATHALNIAIKTLVKPGDTVLISGYEHNAVSRPLYALEGVRIKVAAAPLFEPEVLYRRLEAQLTGEVSAVICTHVSNVFGYILPVERIAQLCRSRSVPFILDASQSAGCLDISMEQLGADFIAMPGHKGLYGPQGTGLLLCGRRPVPLLQGGTGSASLSQAMPEFLPDRVEAGTHNMPGIAGLLEGLKFVKEQGSGKILAHEQDLVIQAAEGLQSIPGVKVYAAKEPDLQVGVLSFQMENMDCETVGEALGEQDIAVRAGLHCAPLAHRTAGTLEDGTVRVSFSAFNTRKEVDTFLGAVAELAKRNSGTS